ncbi:MAG: hypothetical protein H7844_01380 [Nitrospirae bacterium YQR-1]
MNIADQIINGNLKLFIMGDLSSKEDISLFIKLTEKTYRGIEITFSDAEVLSAKVIERLYSLHERYGSVGLKILVFKRVLTSYLMRLNIKNTLIAENKDDLSLLSQKAIKVIALGGSSGSFDKIKKILQEIPVKNLTFFIVQHVNEAMPAEAEKLFQSFTGYEVVYAQNDTMVKAKTIYLAPPGYHTIVVGEYIYLTREKKVHFARPSVDELFRTLSLCYQEEFLAVLLCGHGKDGSTSLSELKNNCSTVIIEDPEDCEAKDMPLNAVKTGNYDYILPIDGIIGYLKGLGSDTGYGDGELNAFLKDIHKTYGYDFTLYQIESIKRRIATAMAKERIASFYDFRAAVLSYKDMFRRLFFDFSINVTSFFRNPETYKIIRNEILPYLQTYHHIKIWCAGCATGEEPYSMAILLNDIGILSRCQIFATDFNPIIIEQAKNGLFPMESLKISEQNYNAAGGTASFRGNFSLYGLFMKINDNLREKILFFNHNLTTDGVFNEFQLILCRNVLIYFDLKLQGLVLKLFNDSLDMSGFLVLGESENIRHNGGDIYFKPYDAKSRIFKKQFPMMSKMERIN